MITRTITVTRYGSALRNSGVLKKVGIPG